jgi:uncharacterized membrane protein YuzA (DUF378 family)
MFLAPEPSALAYVIVGLAALFALPAFGQRILAFLRDLDEYRANRPKR